MQASSNREENKTVLSFMAHLSFLDGHLDALSSMPSNNFFVLMKLYFFSLLCSYFLFLLFSYQTFLHLLSQLSVSLRLYFFKCFTSNILKSKVLDYSAKPGLAHIVKFFSRLYSLCFKTRNLIENIVLITRNESSERVNCFNV